MNTFSEHILCIYIYKWEFIANILLYIQQEQTNKQTKKEKKKYTNIYKHIHNHNKAKTWPLNVI